MNQCRVIRFLGVCLVGLVIISSLSSIALAAVGGQFSTNFDAGGDSDVPGQEIAVTGVLEFTGSNAVEPRITIRSGRGTVLAADSVEAFVEGSTVVDLEKSYGEGFVRYSAEEIPTGTTVELRFNVYPVGLGKVENVDSSKVTVRYDTPNGEDQRKEFETSTNLTNGTLDRLQESQSEIDRLQTEVNKIQGSKGRQNVWALIGKVLSGLFLLGVVVGIWLNRRSGPEPP